MTIVEGFNEAIEKLSTRFLVKSGMINPAPVAITLINIAIAIISLGGFVSLISWINVFQFVDFDVVSMKKPPQMSVKCYDVSCLIKHECDIKCQYLTNQTKNLTLFSYRVQNHHDQLISFKIVCNFSKVVSCYI